MELKEFISDVLKQMEDIKSDNNKQNYLVDNLEFELSLTKTEKGSVGVNFFGAGANAGIHDSAAQRVKITLTPKNKKSITIIK